MPQDIRTRFIADTAGYERNVKRARKTTAGFGSDLANIKRLLIGGAGAYGLKRAFTEFTTAAAVQERAEKNLAAALRQTGDATSKNLKSLKDYASALQRQTVYGDEVLLQQMAYLKNMGMSTSQMKDATRAAIGLSATYNKDLSTSMRLVALAAKGETGQLKEMGIVLDQTKTKQEQFNQLMGMGISGYALATADAKTTAGAIQQFKNAISDLSEAIGNKLNPALSRAASIGTGLAESVTDQINYRGSYEHKRAQVVSLQAHGRKLRHDISVYEGRNQPGRAMRAQAEFDRNGAEIQRLRGEIMEMRGIKETGNVKPAPPDVTFTGYESMGGMAAYDAYSKRMDGFYRKLREQRERERQAYKRHVTYISDVTADSFMRMASDSENWKDHAVNAIKDVAFHYLKLALSKQIAGVISGVTGGGTTSVAVMHTGGVVGTDGARARVPAWVFAGAPEYHTGGVAGLKPNEVPAILERGERIIPNGGGGMVPVKIYNQGTAKEGRAAMTPEGVLAIWMDDALAGGETEDVVKMIAAKVRG